MDEHSKKAIKKGLTDFLVDVGDILSAFFKSTVVFAKTFYSEIHTKIENKK